MLYDLDDVMDFGKYKGKSVEDVLEEDPSYLLWLLENSERFEVDDALQDAITTAARGHR